MAIETRIIIGSFTELYTGGGGNYMTQAKATHFHSFWTRKILAPTESIDDFKEVTASEKAKLEAADAAWERPPQSFIDAWNTRADFSANGRYPQWVFGKYNEETGYFELNTILDIDYAEAINIMACAGMKSLGENFTGPTYPPDKSRTMMPIKHGTGFNKAMENNIYIETYQIIGYYGPWVKFRGKTDVFSNCRTLHTILGIIYMFDNISFGLCGNLTNVKIISENNDGKTVNLSAAPLLSLESINYTIENSTKSLTIILHADAYARVTDEMFEAAAAKNITITSA